MYENREETPKAVLVTVDIGEFDPESSSKELAELAKTAGAEVVGRVFQKRETFDKATCIGYGRLLEVADLCQKQKIDLIIFDHELSASQIRNIEEVVGTRVIDRTTLILDIFAQRARSKEGKLQVELAQQRYRLPRLMGMGESLSRLGGGIGTRGPGETKLETDRRHIRRRISALEDQLAELTLRRQRMRSRRKKNGITTVAIMGYTNVGKSTLLNALTHAGVLAEDMLFATLDPTARALLLPNGRRVMLVDTVGLVRRLPHHLVEAFKSTLEEAAESDLILNVCDLSHPETNDQVSVTEKLLNSLEAGEIPVITVLNKIDKLEERPALLPGRTVMISAKSGEGLEELLQKIQENLPETHRRMTLLLPYREGSFLNEIREEGTIFSEEYLSEGIKIDALVVRQLQSRAEPYQD